MTKPGTYSHREEEALAEIAATHVSRGGSCAVIAA